jgi:hypothetical protein
LVEGLTQAAAAKQPSWPLENEIEGLDELPDIGNFPRVQSKQAIIARQPRARLCDLRNRALVLKAAMAQAQEEIGSALGQMHRKVRRGSPTRSNDEIESPWER